ncbi:MAG: hypothetical protein A2428_17260 [Bdellovibrionales bacterium RIFOXYC1_FULL_54_43]|nr:MAG: hypothetical protein A2428_17260 [Bdellovibrionales bacterium RIFOXYC1_FULL_54_43]OFZ84473.1 MAG: hypothetical protein A2603_03125 [Bdellovibrionales bacterium RIFOXYD1_FULL_55_31]
MLDSFSRFAPLVACVILFGTSCSSLNKEGTSKAETPATAAGPDLSYKNRIEHPMGMTIADARSIFLTKGAPKIESLEKCDFDYQAEAMLSRTREELFMTMPSHVRDEPEKHHWCFYAKLIQLEDDLEKTPYIEDRQKLIVSRYIYFVHLARIFQADLDDARYLEFATHNYKRLRGLNFPN